MRKVLAIIIDFLLLLFCVVGIRISATFENELLRILISTIAIVPINVVVIDWLFARFKV